MNVSFGSPMFSATEGKGFAEIVLTKTAGAIGPVSVNLFTRDGNETGIVLWYMYIHYTLIRLMT